MYFFVVVSTTFFETVTFALSNDILILVRLRGILPKRKGDANQEIWIFKKVTYLQHCFDIGYYDFDDVVGDMSVLPWQLVASSLYVSNSLFVTPLMGTLRYCDKTTLFIFKAESEFSNKK